jgi:hypothetical protein
MATVTAIPLTMDYFIADLTTFLVTYNRLRWYRSRGGENGAYEAATAATAQVATLRGDVEPHNIEGKTLLLKVNGTTEVSVTFVSTNPVTTAEAAAEIELASGLINAVDDDGELVITTAATGSGASIEVLESDAAPYLGLVVGDAVIGLDADSTVTSASHQYFYTDQNSDAEFWYKVEFLHATTGDVSELSIPFVATRAQGVPKSETVPCYVRLTDMTGYPLVGQTVSLHNAFIPNSVTSGNKTWKIFRDAIKLTTDDDGYAETRLLRGLVVDVNIGGTGVIRRIQIPTTGTSVDLLDASLSVEDEFGIAEPNIDFAVRTS